MVIMIEDAREIRGLAILAMGNQIRRINSSAYHVRSQSGNGWYSVEKEGLEWKCSCPDFIYRNTVCKHIHAVQFSLNLRERISSENLGFEYSCEDNTSCKYCNSSNIIKLGFRCNKRGNVQRYLCKDCRRKFSINTGFEKTKGDPKVITLAMDLYFKGVSLRKIVDHLKQFYGVKVTHVAILKWIQKYTRLMKLYVEGLKPEVSGIWHTDEMTVNINGEFNWLWNLMDHDTRFLLASQISKKREIEDARKVFAEAKTVANNKPDFVVTDGLRAYQDAFNKEFFTLRSPRTQHVRLAGLAKADNNNMVERLQGTIRERNKVMRALDNDKSAPKIIDGFKEYYNFIRPHMSLNGKTPAEVAGINLKLGQNKWLSLIQRSAKNIEPRKLPPEDFNPANP